MSGPGVAINSDLNSTGMGVDGVSTFGPYTFPASASYTVQQAGGTAVTFGTTGAQRRIVGRIERRVELGRRVRRIELRRVVGRIEQRHQSARARPRPR